MHDSTLPAIRHPHIIILVIASAIGPLAMNAFLPSLASIADHFSISDARASYLVPYYLLAIALMQLIIGPFSDFYGRRAVMLVSMIIFLPATLGVIYAPNYEFLIFCRFLQAACSAGIVLSRAIVRDLVPPDQAASKLGYVTMGMALAPMVGPLIGGYLDELWGWQSVFWMLFGCGIFTLVVIYLGLPETNHHRSSSLTEQAKTYPELIRSRRFWGYAATAAFTSGAFFAFLGGARFVAGDVFGLSSIAFGWYFGLIALGYIFGNFLSGTFSARFGINNMMFYGNAISFFGIALSISLFAVGLDHPASFFGPILVLGIGNGISLPSANVGLVSVRPHLAGSASGLGGSMQIAGGALLSFAGGSFLDPQNGPYPLLIIMLVSALLAIVATLYVIYVAKQHGRLAEYV